MDSFINNLNQMEQNEETISKIEETITPFLYPDNNEDPNSIITLYIYLLEFKLRHFNPTQDNPNTLRNLFTNALHTVTELNLSINYIDIIYHMWAEFETYKTKNIQMLHKVMTTFCQKDKSIHTFRAYLYYIKTIGTTNDIRSVYKKAYDYFTTSNQNEEKSIIASNWISWEKIFGNIDSINNVLSYTYSQYISEPIQEQIEEKKIIIKNIPETFEEKDIENLIKERCPLIEIKDIRLIKNEDGISRQFAFVDLYTNENAIKIVNILNNIKINENIITCALSKSPKDGANDKRTIFVNNLSYDITKEQIIDTFIKYGEILDVRIINNPKTNKPRGYCYVEFSKEESTIKCLNDIKVNPIMLLGRKLIIGQSVSINKLRNKVEYVVYVSNLSFQLKEEELIMFFEKECNIERKNIVKVVICRDGEKKNKSKGFGFVEFVSVEDMNEALKGSGKMLKGRNVVIKESNRQITQQKRIHESHSVSENESVNENNEIYEDEIICSKKRKRDNKEDGNELDKDENIKVKEERTKKNNNYFKSLFNK